MAFLDPGRGVDSRYIINHRDDSCRARPNVRRHIDHAVDTWRQNQAQECSALAEFVASGRDTLRSVSVDHDAVQVHIDRWC